MARLTNADNRPASSSSVRRGPLPGAQSDLQQVQRSRSRRAIVEGLRELIALGPYDAITIENILGAAQVSRATFYRHFKAKRDVALALYENMMAESIPHFDVLGKIVPGDFEATMDWVKGLVAIYRRNGPASALILQLGVLDPLVHARLRADRMWLVPRIAPATPTGDSSLPGNRQVRADLWLMALDRICVEVAVHGDLPDAPAYMAEVAWDYLSLIGGKGN